MAQYEAAPLSAADVHAALWAIELFLIVQTAQQILNGADVAWFMLSGWTAVQHL